MNEWSRKAEKVAEEITLYEPDREYRYLFEAGVEWLRENLQTPEAFRQAALGIHASHERGEDFEYELESVQEEYLEMGEAAIMAVLGGIDG